MWRYEKILTYLFPISASALSSSMHTPTHCSMNKAIVQHLSTETGNYKNVHESLKKFGKAIRILKFCTLMYTTI